MLSACASQPGTVGFGAQLSDSTSVRSAARAALVAPGTWIPLALAATTQISDWDHSASRWAAREQPLFGSDASDTSDRLKQVATGAYFATALLAPSHSWSDRAKGLGLGVSTMLVEGALSEGLKATTKRERPNGRGNKSFPSGHASQAASRAGLARVNLRYFDLAPWQEQGLSLGLHGVAAGTAWARVEANKHHLSDVLVGLALGNFLAQFATELFAHRLPSGARLDFAPAPGGGAVSFHFVLE